MRPSQTAACAPSPRLPPAIRGFSKAQNALTTHSSALRLGLSLRGHSRFLPAPGRGRRALQEAFHPCMQGLGVSLSLVLAEFRALKVELAAPRQLTLSPHREVSGALLTAKHLGHGSKSLLCSSLCSACAGQSHWPLFPGERMTLRPVAAIARLPPTPRSNLAGKSYPLLLPPQPGR